MANDREFIIQPLIAEKKVLTLADVDPATTYLQVGVWQANQNKSRSAENAYPSYVIPLSEIGGSGGGDVPSNAALYVDSVYGDDATAEPYNAAKPYATGDAAITAAFGMGDTIVFNTGFYLITVNALQKSLTYNLKSGAQAIFMGANSSTAAGENYKFQGDGLMVIGSNFLFEGNFNGDITIDVDQFVLSGGFIYIDPLLYAANPISISSKLKIKANKMTIQSGTVMGVLYPSFYEFTLNVNNYESHLSANTADFWNTGTGTGAPFSMPVNSYMHIGTYIGGTSLGSSAPVFRIVGGIAGLSNVYITGTYYLNNPTGLLGGTIIGTDSSFHNVFFNGKAVLNNAALLYDADISGTLVSTGFVHLKGECYSTTAGASLIFAPVSVSAAAVKLECDIIFSGTLCSPVQLKKVSAQVDIVNCQIVNTNPATTVAAVTLDVVGAKLRMSSAKIVSAFASISSPVANTAEIYLSFTNTAAVNITNTLVAGMFMVDPAVSSNNK